MNIYDISCHHIARLLPRALEGQQVGTSEHCFISSMTNPYTSQLRAVTLCLNTYVPLKFIC